MRRMTQSGAFACAALASFLAQTADSKPLDEILAAGEIRIGVHPNLPRMSTQDSSGRWSGFDIEIGSAIVRELGVEVEWVAVGPGQQAHYLINDEIDIALGELRRSPELARVIDFTLPLHTEVLAVLATGDIEGASLEDFKRLSDTLANHQGNTAAARIKKYLPQARLEIAGTVEETIPLGLQGHANATVESIDFLQSHVRNFPDVTWRRIEEHISVHYCVIGVGQGNANLVEVLNIILHGLHSSGMIADAWETHNGAPMIRPVEPDPYF